MRALLLFVAITGLYRPLQAAVLIRHAIENIPQWQSLGELLFQNMQHNGQSDTFTFDAQRPDALQDELNRHPLRLGIILQSRTGSGPILAGSHTQENPFLSPAKKRSSRRLKTRYLKNLSATSPDIGELPLSLLDSVAVPHIYLSVPRSLPVTKLSGLLAEALIQTFPKRFQPKSTPEPKVREDDILSWIQMESDDETWMEAFREFEKPPESKPTTSVPNLPPKSDPLPRASHSQTAESTSSAGIVSADMSHIQSELAQMARYLRKTSSTTAPASEPQTSAPVTTTTTAVLPRPNWLPPYE